MRRKKKNEQVQSTTTNKGNSLLRNKLEGRRLKKKRRIASSAVITMHKNTSQNSRRKGLGSKHKNRDGEEGNKHTSKRAKKERDEVPYSRKHVLSATKSRYQAPQVRK